MANNLNIKNNIHEGHRERMRKKIEQGSIKTFSDHEVLETLLYNVIKRGNTNETAHNLISTFGNLKNVLSANKFELASVKGVGKETSNFIENLGELFKRCLSCESKITKIDNISKVKEFVRNYFKFELNESIIMICADKNLKVLQVFTLSSGDSSVVKFSVLDALKSAILVNAKFVILAHNHINAQAEPSPDDYKTTKLLLQKFAQNGIVLLDHVITNGDAEFSFRSSDNFYDWFEEININIKQILLKSNIEVIDVASHKPEQDFMDLSYFINKKRD